MNLPTQAEVNAASRHVISAIGGAVIMFGLSTKINIDTVTNAVNALGSITNNIVILVGILAPLYAGWKATHSASPTQQAISLEKQGAVVITTPEIAKATPDSPNIVSQDQVKVVPK